MFFFPLFIRSGFIYTHSHQVFIGLFPPAPFHMADISSPYHLMALSWTHSFKSVSFSEELRAARSTTEVASPVVSRGERDLMAALYLSNAARAAAGCLCHGGTLLPHVQLGVHQDSQSAYLLYILSAPAGAGGRRYSSAGAGLCISFCFVTTSPQPLCRSSHYRKLSCIIESCQSITFSSL